MCRAFSNGNFNANNSRVMLLVEQQARLNPGIVWPEYKPG